MCHLITMRTLPVTAQAALCMLHCGPCAAAVADCSRNRAVCQLTGEDPGVSERRTAPTVLQMALGRRLQELRESAGLTAAEAGAKLRVASSTITRIEGSVTGLKYATVKTLLELYGVVGDDRQRFLDMVDAASQSGWWQGYHDVLPTKFGVYVSLETAAAQIRSYEPQVVPGILQTEAYCEAVIRLGFPKESDDEVKRRVALRMERIAVLRRASSPPKLWAVLDETMFRRSAGTAQIMRDQIDHLLTEAERPNITLQIHPFAAGLHRGAFAPFTVFRFPMPDFPDVACVDSLHGTAYLDNTADVSRYRETFEHMITQALPKSGTRKFLSHLRKEHYA